jgi:hypothetical protein
MVNAFPAIRLTRWLRGAAYKEFPKDAGDALIFHLSRPARYLFRFWIVLAGVIGVSTFFVGVEWYVGAISIPAFLILLTQWPWPVILDRQGISKRTHFGVRKTIQWLEVTSLTYDVTSGRFTIVGQPGHLIRCSPYMVSPATFHLQMYKRATALGPMPTRTSFE